MEGMNLLVKVPQTGQATASPLVDARTRITSPASSTASTDNAENPENTTLTSFATSDTNDHDKPLPNPATDPTTESAPETITG